MKPLLRRSWLGFAMAALLAHGAAAQEAAAASAAAPASATAAFGHCVIVFSSGRNTGSEEAMRDWNVRNEQLGRAITARLEEAGWSAEPFFVPIGSTPGAAVQQMLGRAASRGCRRIVDAAVFEDTSAGVLVVRARLHPLLGLAGPRVSTSLPEVGDALYDSRQEFDRDSLARLTPARLTALGRTLAEGMLEKID